MKRKLLPILLAGTAVVWLSLSYLPPDKLVWQTGIDERLTPLLLVAFGASALLFLGIQVALIASVFTFSPRVHRRIEHDAEIDRAGRGGRQPDQDRTIRIVRRWELLWTTIPLVVSIALFAVSYWAMHNSL